MAANLERIIQERVRALPLDKQQKVLALVEEMLCEDEQEPERPKDSRPIWEIIDEISRQAPPGTWDDLPTDGAINHDHYLYGAPKKTT
jgi:hypothetical protein